MPELTQQQWLMERIADFRRTVKVLRGDNSLAAYLTHSWPSSPQGLAAKALVDAAATAVGNYQMEGHSLQIAMPGIHRRIYALSTKVDAARKTGL